MMNMVQVNENVQVSKKAIDYYGESHIIISARLMAEVDFPTVELTTMDGDNYYLHPFRGYRMQISGSVDGNGDYGSSDVVGLGNIMCLSKESDTMGSEWSIYSSWFGSGTKELQKEFFRLLVNQAMTNAMGGCRDWYVGMSRLDFNKVIDDFINVSMKYIDEIMSK